jgi:hypothetical protein
MEKESTCWSVGIYAICKAPEMNPIFFQLSDELDQSFQIAA